MSSNDNQTQRAREASKEIRQFFDPWLIDHDSVEEKVTAIILRALNGSEQSDTRTGEGELDAAVDEVQRRMDAVVDAAVEWHQSVGLDEHDKTYDMLGKAIDSLLELRGTPA